MHYATHGARFVPAGGRSAGVYAVNDGARRTTMRRSGHDVGAPCEDTHVAWLGGLLMIVERMRAVGRCNPRPGIVGSERTDVRRHPALSKIREPLSRFRDRLLVKLTWVV